jgi:hypothetical protein
VGAEAAGGDRIFDTEDDVTGKMNGSIDHGSWEFWRNFGWRETEELRIETFPKGY